MDYKHLINYLDDVFKRLGASDVNLQLAILDSDAPYASASGINISGKIYGRITLTSGLFKLLDWREIKYVLGHEAVHIYMNHLPVKLLSKSIKNALVVLSIGNPAIAMGLLTSEMLNLAMYKLGGLPSEAKITKEQELQADLWSIILMGDPEPAVNALIKLSGGDLSKPSHLWEALGIPLPVMSVEERLSEILKRVIILKREGIL